MQARPFHTTPRLAAVSRSLTEINFAANIQPGSVALSNQLVYCECLLRIDDTPPSHRSNEPSGPGNIHLPSKRRDSSPA
jgi:hypothetical protein